MVDVKVFDILGKPVLTSRQSARRIEPTLAGEPHTSGMPLCLDFAGTYGVSPSFMDEALRVAEECMSNSGKGNGTVVFAHLPSKMSSSHHAIARAHGRTLVVNEAGDWEFRKI